MTHLPARLALLSLFALPVLTAACGGSSDTKPATPVAQTAFGVVIDPWHIDEWTTAVGAKPTFTMQYEAWAKDRTLERQFEEVKRQGLDAFMVTWEPWANVPSELGKAAQAAIQPDYTNAKVAAGAHDDYIRRWARSIKDSGLSSVYIRYAHEMNGNWYPWSNDPEDYKLAWRHIVDIFRAEGAGNAKFIYSPDPSLFLTDEDWTKGFWARWPGDEYVDEVGSTVVNLFAGAECAKTPCPTSTTRPVELFAKRLELAHNLTNRPVFITEFNTVSVGRTKWMSDLHDFVTKHDWVKGMTLSQAPSRAQLWGDSGVGDLSWQVETDAETKPIVRSIIQDVATAVR